MKLIKIEEWGSFPVGKLFDIHPTKAYKLTNSSLMEEDGVGVIEVVLILVGILTPYH